MLACLPSIESHPLPRQGGGALPPPLPVVAASVGNHAQGVALAASAATVPSTIIMPVWASVFKQQASRGYGAEMRLIGNSLLESITDIERAMNVAGYEFERR